MPGQKTFCCRSNHGFLAAALSLLFLWLSGGTSPAQPALEAGWDNPPNQARLRAYWWWLNGNVTKESITRDLEEMKAKGFGGAVIIDAGGANQEGNAQVPHGPTFFTPEWRELYKHALREANRLGLEMSLNIQSGWNLGGPMVTADDAAKKLVWSELRVTGPTNFDAAPARAPEPRQLLPRQLCRRLSPPAGSAAASAAGKLAGEGAAQDARTVFRRAGAPRRCSRNFPPRPARRTRARRTWLT